MCTMSLGVVMIAILALYTHVCTTGVHWCPWPRNLQLHVYTCIRHQSPVLCGLWLCVLLTHRQPREFVIINFHLLSICSLVLVHHLLISIHECLRGWHNNTDNTIPSKLKKIFFSKMNVWSGTDSLSRGPNCSFHLVRSFAPNQDIMNFYCVMWYWYFINRWLNFDHVWWRMVNIITYKQTQHSSLLCMWGSSQLWRIIGVKFRYCVYSDCSIALYDIGLFGHEVDIGEVEWHNHHHC